MRPLIGITCDGTSHNPVGWDVPGSAPRLWNTLAEEYVTAILSAGGLPVPLPICGDENLAREYAEHLDGVLFTGGGDLDPALYGEENSGSLGVLADRDRFEITLLHYLTEKTDLPFLAICRGIQLMNVALGGTLIQDLPAAGLPKHAFFTRQRWEITHHVTTAEGSLLRRITGETVLPVNSFHHQAVREPAPGVVITAADSACAKVVEAIELPQRKAFTLGVQWHPECLYGTQPTSRAVLNAFVAAAVSGRNAE